MGLLVGGWGAGGGLSGGSHSTTLGVETRGVLGIGSILWRDVRVMRFDLAFTAMLAAIPNIA